LISWSSSTASSSPATSENVILGWSLVTTRALALPKDITRLPPPCICCIRKKKNPTISRMGKNWNKNETSTEPCSGSAVTSTLKSRACSAKSSIVPWGKKSS
jgi:hypothetical protein